MWRNFFRKKDAAASGQVVDESIVTTDNPVALRKRLRDTSCWPLFLLALISLCINADQNLIAPNLTQIAREFNMTDDERDYKLGGQISLGFFLVGGFAAMIVGYLADIVNRRNLFVAVIVIGETSTFCTLFVTDYWGLFITRAITGISIGGSNPLVMSMIGDLFSDQSRGKAIALITIMFTLGVGLGQAVSGFIGPADAYGWRAPFAVMAIPIFILAPLLLLTTRDPPRGGKERAVQALSADGGLPAEELVYDEKMDLTKLKKLMKNKTAVLGFTQGIPGSLPWGVLLVYFQDFLVQNIGPTIDGGITVQQSSVVLLCFSLGASVGTAIGGWLSDRIWNKNPRGVTIMMAIAACLAAIPIYGLINSPPSSIAVYSVVLFPCGMIAGVIGPAIRTVLMNVTLPETRGTAFAFHTLFDDIGKGLGPLWVSMLIRASGSRVQGFNAALAGWFVCGLIMFAMTCFVKGDVKKLEDATLEALRRRAQGPGHELPMTTFGTDTLSSMKDLDGRVRSDPSSTPISSVFPSESNMPTRNATPPVAPGQSSVQAVVVV